MFFMKKIAVAISCIFYAVIPIVAQANGIAYEPWSGLYFGFHFGSGAGNADTSLNDGFFSQTTTEQVGPSTIETATGSGSADLSGDITGSIADLFVGYNFQFSYFPQLIIGGQLEGVFFSDITFEDSGQEASSSIDTTNDGVTLSTSTTQSSSTIDFTNDLTSMFTFLARAGYLIKPNILVYALGGGAEGNFVTPAARDLTGQQRNQWVLGYTVGAGLEYKINPHWSLRGEYRYINFDIDQDRSVTFDTTTDPDGPNNLSTTNSTFTRDTDTDFGFNMGKIGIVYQFDMP